ncbi:uncharacterized protein EV422DRAFT_504213 [Fimicolochytrium jonesii]|uniref:uncharacterized protein n=1 Tax=Fimicolochytrium jonesii TaxID=1396493 RepID=UPI0022FED636|nr:uncharacterized protein EV422DRAFT_504213 [Fimicolochytrium jonesii]KAI8824166.1 hypothetical protein EV422DRAFT_504213 [Fimicolochytrium jonesii]
MPFSYDGRETPQGDESGNFWKKMLSLKRSKSTSHKFAVSQKNERAQSYAGYDAPLFPPPGTSESLPRSPSTGTSRRSLLRRSRSSSATAKPTPLAGLSSRQLADLAVSVVRQLDSSPGMQQAEVPAARALAGPHLQTTSDALLIRLGAMGPAQFARLTLDVERECERRFPDLAVSVQSVACRHKSGGNFSLSVSPGQKSYSAEFGREHVRKASTSTIANDSPDFQAATTFPTPLSTPPRNKAKAVHPPIVSIPSDSPGAMIAEDRPEEEDENDHENRPTIDHQPDSEPWEFVEVQEDPVTSAADNGTHLSSEESIHCEEIVPTTPSLTNTAFEKAVLDETIPDKADSAELAESVPSYTHQHFIAGLRTLTNPQLLTAIRDVRNVMRLATIGGDESLQVLSSSQPDLLANSITRCQELLLQLPAERVQMVWLGVSAEASRRNLDISSPSSLGVEDGTIASD